MVNTVNTHFKDTDLLGILEFSDGPVGWSRFIGQHQILRYLGSLSGRPGWAGCELFVFHSCLRVALQTLFRDGPVALAAVAAIYFFSGAFSFNGVAAQAFHAHAAHVLA